MFRLVLIVVGLLHLVSSSARGQDAVTLTLVKTTPLADVEGRIDHMAIDSKLQRLYVAALGNNTVEVINLATGERSGQIKGLKTPQGIRVLPETGTVVVASGGDGKCRFYDKDLKLAATIDGLEDADNVRYDSVAKLIYVGYGDGAIAVIDPDKHIKIADIKLSGHPESFQLERQGNRIFVNVPTAKQVAVIDRTKRVVIATWPVREAESNFPMLLDEANHRVLIGCRKPAKVIVLDTVSGKAVARFTCCGDADDMFYDALSTRVYVSGGEGFISVAGQQKGDHYRSIGRVKTAAGARSSLFDSGSRKLYLSVPHRDAQPAELRTYAAPTANP